MTYNETTAEVYINKEEIIKPENSNNNKTDRLDIYLDKPKQEVLRKDQGNKRKIVRQILKIKKN